MKPKDLISLVCAYDSILLKKEITTNIWKELETRIDVLKTDISFLNNANIIHNLDQLVKDDAKTLLSYWCSLNYNQQNDEHRNWLNLNPEKKEEMLYGDAKDYIRKELNDPKIIDIADRVLRYGQLTNKFSIFWENYLNYYKNNKEKAYRDKLLDSWSDLFVVLVAPVKQQDNIYHLRTLGLKPKYKIGETVYSHLDGDAYNSFFSYINAEMNDIQCCDYRQFKNAGVRSLNSAYFNNLDDLLSIGDHPAALLCGCRSGIQFQVRSDEKIVGMVMIYFPLYGLWEIFNLNKYGFLLGHNNLSDSEKAYCSLLKNELTKDNDFIRFAKLITTPVKFDKKPDEYSIVNHLSYISSKPWHKIYNTFSSHIPENIQNLLRSLTNNDFDTNTYSEIASWFWKMCFEAEATDKDQSDSVATNVLGTESEILSYYNKWEKTSTSLVVENCIKKILVTEKNINDTAEILKNSLWKLLYYVCEKLNFEFGKWLPSAYEILDPDTNLLVVDLFRFSIAIHIMEGGVIHFDYVMLDKQYSNRIPINALFSNLNNENSIEGLINQIKENIENQKMDI